MNKNIQKFLNENNDIDAEKNVDEGAIFGRILEGYDGGQSHGLDNIHYHLQEAFRSGALTCLVCIETVTEKEAVWNCEKCFASFHLHCIQKWAKDSLFLQSQAENEDTGSATFRAQRERPEIKWFCPKCRHDYPKTSIPYDYKCFCGKTKQPEFDPWLIPHSCGEKCMKKLKPICGHSCLLLCHPGPCPPCPVMVSINCHCQKSKPTMRRCSVKYWSCHKPCNQYLACNRHRCKELCHEGQCPPCILKSNQKCQCNSSSQLRSCSDLVWQCDRVCGKALPCTHHNCEQICHSGECGACPRGGERACPCGKMMHDLPCTELVPTCGDTCSKPLACGVHFCMERCHKYACPSCLQVRVKKCNCGQREKELPCHKNFSCDVKCKRRRDCGKHSCNRKCCVGDCPSCDQACGKTLSCGIHKCESRCHRTKCFPCSLTHKISCTCGGTTITVPCGRQSKTPIPKCTILCKKKSICHHPSVKPHRCHEGKCPPCKMSCGLKLKCNHICPASCHDAVEVRKPKAKRAGPWEQVSTQTEIQAQPCPPCVVNVPITCYGKHETIKLPCYKFSPYSCGAKCERRLKCSHHKCSERCHIVIGSEDSISEGVNCKPCILVCSQPRPQGCTHKCKLPCHPGLCPDCKENIRMKCHCSILQITLECQKWSISDDSAKESLQSCTSQCSKLIPCGHRCRKLCHSGECSLPSDCRRKVAVRCPCKRIRKDVLCYLASSSQSLVNCDDSCREKEEEARLVKEAEVLKAQQEEMERLQQEQEEFDRLMGRKKKRRKRFTSETEVSQKYFEIKHIVALTSIFVLILCCFLYYYFKQ